MNRRAHATLAAALSALSLAVAPAGAAASDNTHFVLHDVFPDQLCGIDGTSSLDGVVNVSIYQDTFSTRAQVTQVFTADDGHSVTMTSAQRNTGPLDPVDNGDGTITFVQTFRGLYSKVSVTGGPTLLRNAGVMTAALTFDGDGNLLSFDVLSTSGPHPSAGDDSVFCDALAPYL